MNCLLALLLALKSATVIDVQGNHEVTFALHMGDASFRGTHSSLRVH
jgi:hypothetical protein